jgi:NAD(P)-dependent dehydrogenase (short-subunit alcohol dehydrogenase family)
MDLQLAGNVAVVVGGARGIGAAIAREFAQEKCQVALVDRDRSVASVAREMQGSRGYCADATELGALQNVAAAIAGEMGPVRHLVFAVGVGSGKFGFPFWDVPPATWPRVLEVNVVTAVNTLHAFAPALIEAREGTVLLISSIAGQIGSQTDPPYSASKAALINFAQCAAKDLAPYNVRVNTLCPGMVKTELNRAVWQAWADKQSEGARQSYDEWAAEKIKKMVPLGRWQDPEDVAALAVFLASPRARNICGQTLNVDGGFVMHW